MVIFAIVNWLQQMEICTMKNLNGILTNPVDLHLTSALGAVLWELIQLNSGMHRSRRQRLLLLRSEELLTVHIANDMVTRPLNSIVVPLGHINVDAVGHLLIILAIVQEELQVVSLRIADLGVINLAANRLVLLVGPQQQNLVVGGGTGRVARASLPSAVLLANVPSDAARGAVSRAADGQDAVGEVDGCLGAAAVAGVAWSFIDGPFFGEGCAVELVLVG